MSELNKTEADRLVGNLDNALALNPAITEQQFDDVQKLRRELQDHCRAGRLDEAKRCEELALMVIREGAPAAD